METEVVQCELCRQFVPADSVEAFELRSRQLNLIELHGQSPWSGIRCLCVRCVDEVASASDRYVFNPRYTEAIEHGSEETQGMAGVRPASEEARERGPAGCGQEDCPRQSEAD